MPELNPQQRAAVRHLDSPLLVLAGAGSGKTRVITEKVAYLIEQAGLPARLVTAVTFTNKAAREMRSRLSGRLRRDRIAGLTVSTFHSLGLRILQREHARLGYRSGFSVIDAQDSLALLGQLRFEQPGCADEAEALRARISAWKNDLVDAEQALAQAADEREAAQARLYAAYRRQLKACNALDFDDLLVEPVRLLRAEPAVVGAWRERVRHLLVDEYQDTNAVQYELVRLLVGPRPGLTVVGDDDQSIYAWRGARPENLARLTRDFPALTVIKLEQNYRSCGQILGLANHLIANNAHVFEKRLWSALGPGDRPRVLVCDDAEDEARRVAAEILQHRLRHGREWRDYAVLYRGNFQSRPFEKALREHDIPYQVSGGTAFFDRGEVKDVMAYLRLLANPDDDAAFLRIVNTPRREIGPGTLERLGEYAQGRGISLFSASFEAGLAHRLAPRAAVPLARFTRWLAGRHEEAAGDRPVAVARALVEDIGYRQWLLDSSRDPRSAQRRWENVEELLDWMDRMAGDPDSDASIEALVARMSLFGMLDRDGQQTPDAVQLMTLHAAKGLEFRQVFLVGMEENSLPHHGCQDDPRALEEERRLAYVGITRAREGLTFTWARCRQRAGERVDCVPSRFLAELPAEALDQEGLTAPDPARRLERGRESLAALRDLLGG